jgi:hypothetical protein
VKTRAEKLEEIFQKILQCKKFLHITFLHSNLPKFFVEGVRSMKNKIKILINHKITTICQVVKERDSNSQT